MKIGLVRRGFSATGGAEAYLRRFAEAAGAAGHRCVLFVTEDWPETAKPVTAELVRVRGRTPARFADALEACRPRDSCDFLLSLERVWRCDAYRAGDGVHAAWLQRRAQFEPRWKSVLRGWNPKHRALLALEKSLFEGGAGTVIANSALIKTQIQQVYGYPAGRIRVIYNGLPAMNLPSRARQEVRAELGLSPEEYVLLFVGSGWERKGLRFAVEALGRVSGCAPVLLVAGRGDSRALPDCPRVRYLGPRGDVPRLLAAADAFVLPTLYEPFSNACLEALAAGLPVITTASNGFAEVIESGVEGEVIPEPTDLAALAGAIERWALPARRDGIGVRLQERGTTFSIEENVRQTLEHILAGSGGEARGEG
jgi:UDP-glucose:(heptosyl)LPS alpha-1,3-glucosyltransferase